MKIKNINIYKKQWYLKNRIRLLKERKTYQKEHKEEIKEYQQNYHKKYYQEHKIELKNYYNKNSKEILKRNKIYHSKNKSKILEQIKKYRRNRNKIDINFKLTNYLRKRIWAALKGICKSKSTLKLLGCSVEKFKQHLESKFTLGMSFKNYGKWHIDHIKPCAKFNLSKVSEQKKCFHYTNLQPLWAIDNLKKKDLFKQHIL